MFKEIADYLVALVPGLGSNPQLAGALSYFIEDSLKIIVLLFAMIAAIGFLRTYVSQKRIRALLGSGNNGIGNLIASLFGAITPFCSCSSIPVFISLLQARVNLGVSFSFLITSPLVNEYLVAVMLGLFGWKITVAYVLFGIAIGAVAGFVLGRMGLEQHLAEDLFSSRSIRVKEKKYTTIKQRIMFGINEAFSITRKLWLWILVGVGIGAIIHNLVPQEVIQGVIDSSGMFSVPLAVLLGVPIYGSCAAILPVAAALFAKGVPLGTALAFMMSISALSLPEAVILRRAMKLRLILVFFGTVALGIILIGYLLNFLQGYLV